MQILFDIVDELSIEVTIRVGFDLIDELDLI
jgi:hypothetical protein